MKPTKTLNEYQEVSRDFLLSKTFAACFDSPGVGKSGPAFMAGWQKHLETGLPVLWTGPAYILPYMAQEILDFIPEAKVEIANGAGFEKRLATFQGDADFILTSYENWSAKWPTTLPKPKNKYDRPDIETADNWKAAQPERHPLAGQHKYKILSERQWAACILDESHRTRGRSSQTTKHIFELRKAKAPNLKTPVWLLSGTPIVNNPTDLYSALHLYSKSRFKSDWRFAEEYCYITKTQWSTDVGQLRKGMEEEFQALLGEFSLRRTLADIPSLATLESRSRDYVVDLPASVRKTFVQARKEYIIEHPDLDGTEFVNGGGALYSRLRQMATNPPTAEKPKISFVQDFLQDHFGPVVVYVWYKDSARAVRDGLVSTKRPVTLVTGDVPTNKRTELVDQWKSSPNGILVATISSLKEGISLIHAQDVIFLEHSPLPADQDQCIARLKRRGQTSLVNVHNVFAKGTPDTSIRRHLNERNLGLKRALVSWLRGEDDG